MPDALNSDQAFIRVLTEIVLKNLKNEDFRIGDLAREVGLSSSTLNRRLTRVLGKTGNQFIREIRLRKAHELLQDKSVNVSEVSYAVGFGSPAYFSACFHEFFGYPPRDVSKESPVSLHDHDLPEPAWGHVGKRPVRELVRIYRTRILSLLIIVTGIAVFAYLKYQGHSSVDDLRSSDGRISVAVMPFDNLTGNKTWDCIQFNLISYLSSFDELTVRQKEAVDLLLRSRGVPVEASVTPSVASAVSRKLDSKVYVSGIISRAGTRSRVNVQLVNSGTMKVIRSFMLEDESDEHNIYRMIDSVSASVKNYLVTEKMAGETGIDQRPYKYTNSPVALDYFLKAEEAMGRQDIMTVKSLYQRAVESDSCFIPAIIFLSMRYGEMGEYAEARKWCLKAYSIKDQAHLKERYMIQWYHAVLFGTPEDEIRFLRQYVAVDDNVPIVFWMMGNAYNILSRFDYAAIEFENTLKIYRKWDVRPMGIWMYTSLADAYRRTGDFQKAKRVIRKAAKTFPEESWILLKDRALLACSMGDTAKGNRLAEEYRSEMAANSKPATEILKEVASLYNESGNTARDEKNLREALALRPDDPEIINSLAYLLIDKGLNVEEGLRLAEEGLQNKPDDPYLLHTLGWGLARTGRSEEALEVLNKSWDLRPGYNQILLQHMDEARRQNYLKGLI